MATKNFSNNELECPCGCGLLPAQRAQNKLQALRELYAAPIYIESGARCAAHNADIRGAPGSHHTPNEENNHEPCAFDIKAKTFANACRRGLLLSQAIKVGFTCHGGDATRFHIDCRPEHDEKAGQLVLYWGY